MDVNLLAVPVAALTVFVIGGPWYGPLFGKAWHAATGVTQEKVGHPAKVFGMAFVFGLIGALAVAVVAGPAPTLPDATVSGLGVGVAAAAAFGINYQFAAKPLGLLLIDGVYSLALFTAMGAVIGLFG
ncbi:MAG: DUF1761 domain-containing protein [Rhodospirillaceae bacterium]|nr:DUF1761 domain-containing protein [Rhodospirillaceae bacterium]